MTTRRHVLSLLAASPLAGCGGGPEIDPAEGWRDPGAGETDPRRFALAHAVLAPNPHNTQPWLVTLDGDDGLILHCDLERRLDFTDPLDRQITIGCGAFLELYRIAARQLGRAAQVTFFPEGAPTPRLDARPVAYVRFAPQINAAPDPLYPYVTARRTNRKEYEERVPDDVDLLRVNSAVGGFLGAAAFTVDPARVAALRDLVWRGFERELQTAGAQEETYHWLRFGENEVARQRDGLPLSGPMIPLLKAAGFLDREDFLNPDSIANQTAASDWRKKAETAQAFMWLTTADDTPATRLSTGMAYARLNLAATAHGFAMHPWSQALQEYEAMADLYAEAKRLLDAETKTVQMLVRVGYAEAEPPSPRRALSAFVT
ncbi:MAG: nitroreductase family protein [Hyphomonadaceae bacterium]